MDKDDLFYVEGRMSSIQWCGGCNGREEASSFFRHPLFWFVRCEDKEPNIYRLLVTKQQLSHIRSTNEKTKQVSPLGP